MLLMEAKAAAGLQHPNIVSIHEVGQHEGWHYFSMDYVDGRDLSAILRENLLPPKRAASYICQMAEAIYYAHQQGMLHRDLKPSNILIDSQDQIRITDFGLAMRLEGDSQLTRTGQIMGTPSYMPPEQAQGIRRLIGPGSDVYATGAVLYECLTGRAPFRAVGCRDDSAGHPRRSSLPAFIELSDSTRSGNHLCEMPGEGISSPIRDSPISG